MRGDKRRISEELWATLEALLPERARWPKGGASALAKHDADPVEQLGREFVLFQQISELHQRGRIGHRPRAPNQYR